MLYSTLVNSIYIPVVAFQQFVNLQKGVQQIVGALTKKEQLVLTLLLFAELLSVSRGVESIKRLGGGAVSRDTFGMKRAPEKFPPEMLARGIKKNDCNHKKCNLNNIFSRRQKGTL